MPGLRRPVLAVGLAGKIARLSKDKVENPEDHILDVNSAVEVSVKHVYKKEAEYKKLVEVNDPDLLSCSTIEGLKERVIDKVIKIPKKIQGSDGKWFDSWDYVFTDHQRFGGNMMQEIFTCPEEFIDAWRKHNNLSSKDIMTREEAQQRKDQAEGYRVFTGEYLNRHLHGNCYDHTYVDSVYRERYFDEKKDYFGWIVTTDGRGGPDSDNIIYIEEKI